MSHGAELSRVRGLSDGELLSGLNGLLRSSREALAAVIAHLGEVEERRLHLRSGHASMFAYCVSHLRMSEDEACRRLDVARAARRFPLLLDKLASGAISLSVAGLLKGHLTHENHCALIAAVSEKTVFGAREVLASWFPKPDVVASIRKLPSPVRTAVGRLLPVERSASVGAVVAASRADVRAAPLGPEEPLFGVHAAGSCPSADIDVATQPMKLVGAHAPGLSGLMPAQPVNASAMAEPIAGEPSGNPRMPGTAAAVAHVPAVVGSTLGPMTLETARPGCPQPAPVIAPSPRRMPASRSIEPLSPGRYRLQLTASAELKRKLELCRDLLRHSIPSGDLATLIERALDLLLEHTMKRRFAVTERPKRGAPHSPAASADGARVGEPVSCRSRHAGKSAPANPGARSQREPQRPGARARAATSKVAPGNADPAVGAETTRAADAQRHMLDASPMPMMRGNSIDEAAAADATHAPVSGPRDARLLDQVPSPRRISNEVRRAILARDGARCTWHGPDGVRCNSRAWLEHDHIVPFARGGGNDVANIRILCRAHNRLAAEQAYGQPAIARILARRRDDHVVISPLQSRATHAVPRAGRAGGALGAHESCRS